MNEQFPGETMTKAEYDRYVEERGRTPTQDPSYNHKGGNPATRIAASHVAASSFPAGARLGSKPEDKVPNFSDLPIEEQNASLDLVGGVDTPDSDAS